MQRTPRADTREWSVVALLSALLCGSMAHMALDVVLGLQIYDISERPLDLGILGLALFTPSALLVFVTGPIADRFDRRRVAACGLTGEAVCASAIFVYVGTDEPSVVPIFVFAFLFGTARAFASPATRALPADIVVAERVPWVVARSSITWQIAAIVGPVAGGFLYDANPRLPYPVIAALALTAAGLLLTVRLPVAVPRRAPSDEAEAILHEHDNDLAHALEGLRFIRRTPIVLGAISLDLFAVLFGGAVALLPALAEERLGVGPVGVGWLRAAVGIGAASVTLRLAVRPMQRHVGRNLLTAVGVFGVATIVMGATRTYAVAFVAMLVLAGADAVSVFVRATLIPLVTPRAKRGRVLAVENVFVGASNELGAFESGVAGQLLGPAGAVMIGGIATVAIALGWGVLFPALRAIDHFPVAPDE